MEVIIKEVKNSSKSGHRTAHAGRRLGIREDFGSEKKELERIFEIRMIFIKASSVWEDLDIRGRLQKGDEGLGNISDKKEEN